MKTMKKKGFTVVELVIVIAIVAVLAAVLIPTFASLIKKANDSAYLQDRTNQQIADLVEKVEDQDFLTWEDFEAELAKQIASIKIPDAATPDQVANSTELTKAAIAEAVAKFELAVKNNSTALTEDQVKAIVEKALSNSLTTAQVESIVNAAIAKIQMPPSLTAAQVESIVNSAVAKIQMPAAGATAADVKNAVSDVLAQVADLKTLIKNSNGNEVDVVAAINTAVETALANIKLPEAGKTLSADEVKSIVDASLKNLKVLTEAEVSNIVNTAVDGAVATLKNNIGDTGITQAEMQKAIEKALEQVEVNVEVINPGYIGGAGVDYNTIQAVVTNALKAFGVVTEDELDEAIKEAMGTAKKRADEIAADEMNTIVKGIADFEAAVAALDAAGYNVSKLTPIRSGYVFCWDGNGIKCVTEAESTSATYVDILDVGAALITAEVSDSASFEAAITNGNAITLTADIKLDSEVTVPADKKVTLDLNGKSITTEQVTGRSKYLTTKGELVIENGTINARGVQVYGKLVIGENANVVINNVDSNGGAAIWVYAGGEVEINGGTFTALNGVYNMTDLSKNPGVINNSGKVTINGGTFVSENTVCYVVNNSGELVINGGTFMGTHGIIGNYGTTAINGGTFTLKKYPNGQAISGYHIYCPSGTVTINANAVFNGDTAYREYGDGSIIKN